MKALGALYVDENGFLRVDTLATAAPVAVKAPAPAPKKEPTVVEVGMWLIRQGLPSHVKGFHALTHALPIAAKIGTAYITKAGGIYDQVAKAMKDRPSRIERAIRHAIEITLEDTGCPLWAHIRKAATMMTGRPTNSEFISLLVILAQKDGVL